MNHSAGCLADHDFDYFLIRDMDKAGADWVEMITTALHEKQRPYTVLFPPDNLDPDEAFQAAGGRPSFPDKKQGGSTTKYLKNNLY